MHYDTRSDCLVYPLLHAKVKILTVYGQANTKDNGSASGCSACAWLLGQAFQWTQQAVFAERMRGRAVYWEESSDAICIKIPMIFVFTLAICVYFFCLS